MSEQKKGRQSSLLSCTEPLCPSPPLAPVSSWSQATAEWVDVGVMEQGSRELPGGQASARGTHSLQLGSGLVPWDTNRSDEFLGSYALDF